MTPWQIIGVVAAVVYGAIAYFTVLVRYCECDTPILGLAWPLLLLAAVRSEWPKLFPGRKKKSVEVVYRLPPRSRLAWSSLLLWRLAVTAAVGWLLWKGVRP